MASALDVNANRLRDIRTFPSLVKYLHEELDWPVGRESFDDLTFDWDFEELGINPKNSAKIQSIKQLRKFVDDQPWGIFFIKFEPKSLPIVALRRILSGLIIKRRRLGGSDRAAWQLHDLLFISSYGDSDHPEITFAHFAEEPERGELPTLRVLGWDEDNAAERLKHTDSVLRQSLRWPNDESDLNSWRSQWSQAFSLRPGEVIRTAKAMAERLASLAVKIRKRVNEVLSFEHDRGQMRSLFAAFKQALIHDLSPDDFADMYAQTICYGLLTARFSRPAGLIADNLKDMVPPSTNPFLRELLGTFLKIGGRKDKLDFDELGITEVVQILRTAKMEEVKRDFFERNPDEDPTIRFYEDFLRQYDPKKRMQRGVFYTPRPIVSYIVRSVHELLRSEFNLPEGLASTATWSDVARRHPGLKMPVGVAADSPFVQILDPAVGTGTFLVEVIDVVHTTMLAKWERDGRLPLEIPKLWNEYVSKNLLPRLHGYELMMAPYAIAHMKIGLKLGETGYKFASDERARIYLTNSLEPPHDFSDRLAFDAPALAHEAHEVNAIKRRQRFTVIVGNPPYSKMSGNLGEHAVQLIEPFRFVNGERIVERGALALELNIQDDYVKFWGFLRQQLIASNVGMGGFITNSRYLASPTLRGLRCSLKELFDRGAFLDIGGQVSERSAYAGPDENVFDIEQGVAIGVGIRRITHSAMTSVCHETYRGSRERKYSLLSGATIAAVHNIVPLAAPFYRFSRAVDDEETQFNNWTELSEIMPFNSGCIITSRDNLALDFDRTGLMSKIERFATSPRGDRSIERELGYSSKAKWDVEACKVSIRNDPQKNRRARHVLYRHFDERWIYYSTTLLDTPSRPVCESIFDHENLVLLTPKVNTSEVFNHVLVSRTPAEKKACSHNRATQMFPLFRYDSGVITKRDANIDGSFRSELAAVAGEEVTPEAIFGYIYAVLYSPEYRRRFGNALRDSFPRIPVVHNPKLFHRLVKIGGVLIDLHLLSSVELDKLVTNYVGSARPEVGKISYARNTVWIDKDQTCGFQGMSEAVWEFHIGGYQVCDKWLKDRKGRKLSKDEIVHYQRIVVAIAETIRLMKEIDAVIEKHGGWPKAFA